MGDVWVKDDVYSYTVYVCIYIYYIYTYIIWYMRIHMHTRTYILHIHMHIHIHIRLDIDMDMDIDIAIYTHAHHKYIIYTWGRAGGGSWDEDGEEECSWNLLCWSAMKPISPSEGNSWGYIHIDYSKKMSNRWNRYIYIVQHIQYIYI